MKHIFILGNNPELSIAEIKAVFSDLEIIEAGRDFLIGENDSFYFQEAMARLGGTIKIGEIFGEKIDEEKIINEIISRKGTGKAVFGFSFYGVKPGLKIGMRIKGELKKRGINSRLVTSREKTLSSVIVKKEKCLDFLIGPDFLGVTRAAQDFEEYGERDYGRPRSDARSGMLPPKAAKMMINLSGAGFDAVILDPFCGSGTILTEATAMGFTNLVGCDISLKAVKNTQENLEWLVEKLQIQNHKSQINSKFNPPAGGQNSKNQLSIKIFQGDAKELSKKIKAGEIDAIVTEPYLGPPLKGGESEAMIKKISDELKGLYLTAFSQFKKVLAPAGRAVIVFPEWHLGGKIYPLDIFADVAKLGFNRLDENDLMYKREGQKVWRRVVIYDNF